MSNGEWLNAYLDDAANLIQSKEGTNIVKLLRQLFEDPGAFFSSKELDNALEQFTDLRSISILGHEIFYLANIYDRHDPIYYNSTCLRLLSFYCLALLLDEEDEKIKLLDLPMDWYIDHKDYLKPLNVANDQATPYYSSVITSLCLQLLHMGTHTKHYQVVKEFVEQHQDKKFSQDILERCHLV